MRGRGKLPATHLVIVHAIVNVIDAFEEPVDQVNDYVNDYVRPDPSEARGVSYAATIPEKPKNASAIILVEMNAIGTS